MTQLPDFDKLIEEIKVAQPKEAEKEPSKPSKRPKKGEKAFDFSTEPLWRFLFNEYLADPEHLGEHWALKDTELAIYSDSFDKVLDRYLGILIEKAPELVGFILCCMIIFPPRVYKSWKQRKKKKEKKPEKPSTTK